MIATVINAAAIIAGGFLGLLFGARLKPSCTETIVKALSIAVMVIGITPAVKASNILTVVICLVLGTALGELLDIERRLDALGHWLKVRFAGGDSAGTFTQGFVTASLLFCIGSMAVTGSLEAGLQHHYRTLEAKALIDGIMAMTFSVTLGIGVVFSALPVLVYQGLITLLASWAAPLLSQAVITELSAVGGILLIATGLNMLELAPVRIRVGNMLPSILLPVVYMPVADWLTSLF